jgi:hypothetical protein
MKKILLLALLAAAATTGIAQQNSAIEARLRAKYDYCSFYDFNGGWYAVELNGKAGACDLQGNEVIPCKYDYVFKNYDCYKVKLNGKEGACDLQGNEVIPCKYDDVVKPGEYYRVSLNEKIGACDLQGNEIVAPKYDLIDIVAADHAIKVLLNGEWGLLDKQGKELVAPQYKNGVPQEVIVEKSAPYRRFEDYAKSYVQSDINRWQRKGEFEKTADWQRRVNEATRKARVAELLEEAEEAFIAERSKGESLGSMALGAYDPDNEVYLIQSSKHGNLLVPVPIAEAQQFKAKWGSISKRPSYFIKNNDIALASMRFSVPGGKSYTYSNKASLSYRVASIDYNFDPIDVTVPATAASAAPGGRQSIGSVKLQAGAKSDVDVNIPAAGASNGKTFAVIIANETYQEKGVSSVEFAGRDGSAFKEYCTKTLGIPATNVHYRANATLNNIRVEVSWLAQVAKSYRGEASFIFYYAGHGIPDEASGAAYLLPVDGYGSDVKSGYSLDDLYAKLGAMPARSITVFLDACFSGAKRDGSMLAAARGVAVKSKAGAPTGSMVVFSAASGDETAYPYREKGHGLFTYFLLKKLQETKGNVTLGELSRYISTSVQQHSIVVNSKSQTPTVTPAPALAGRWQSIKLK